MPATDITVVLSDGRELPGKVLGHDAKTDLGKRIDDTNHRIDELKTDVVKHIDNGFEHMTMLLKLHEAEHHKK